ncbi:MAG: polyphenol oxidase family protein, partial [Lachnospiraceae bacterium]|nr:polyphenol oxidase family protein [Lachnospiraceae bacterium]
MVWKDGRRTPKLLEQDGIPYLQFESLVKTGVVRHLFTTRGGGVSEGIYASMNLGFTRGDDRKCVEENFRRVARVLGCGCEDMIASDQTHTANGRLVPGAERGHGSPREKSFCDTDGLIPGERG